MYNVVMKIVAGLKFLNIWGKEKKASQKNGRIETDENLKWEAWEERGDEYHQAKKKDLEIKVSQWQDRRNVSSTKCDSPATPASRSYSKYTPLRFTAPPMAFLFSHPFSSCHSKCHSQLVKVHYTLSSWPEIYTLQCLCGAGEGCNPLRLMTVHVSWWKWWIFWLLLWINMIEYHYTELTLEAVILKYIYREVTHDTSTLHLKRGR